MYEIYIDVYGNRNTFQAHQLLEKDREIQIKTDQFQQERNQLLTERSQLQREKVQLQVEITSQNIQLQWQRRVHQEDMASQECQIQHLNKQLEEQEQITAAIQQTNCSKETGGTATTTAESANLNKSRPQRPLT